MRCPKCDATMEKGIAIDSVDSGRCRYLVQFDQTITSETLRLIDVLKCPKCGHSDDGSLPERKFLGCENHNE